MSFLPEDDRAFLSQKALPFELVTEQVSNGSERRGIIFSPFAFEGKLLCSAAAGLVPCTSCDLLILIPSGYATTKLDSFYTSPELKTAGGGMPDRAPGGHDLFGRKWQFWSRHLSDAEWRVGQDGLETYLQYVRSELRRA